MTQVVQVQTDFADLTQMTEGLMERVHETHVILTGPDDIGEGEWVQFAIHLQDGTPGFAGVGRCVRSVDNGDARLPHQRFDLVLDSLQFDQHGQDVYQYILMSRQAAHGDDVAPADNDMHPHEPEADESLGNMPGEATGAYSQEEEYAQDQSEGWHDASGEVELADQATATKGVAPTYSSSGKFLFDGPLPLPGTPPRPDLDPSMRVTPAPRPRDGGHVSEPPGDDPYEEARTLSNGSPHEWEEDKASYEEQDDLLASDDTQA